MNPVKINRVIGAQGGGGQKNVLLIFNKSYLYAAGNLILTLNRYNEGLFYHLFVEKADEEIIKYLFSLGANIKIYDCEINLGFDTNPFHPVQAIRLFAPYLLEDNVEKLVYIDDDMVCKGNIDELFVVPYDGYTIAMAPDFYLNFHIPHIFTEICPATLYCNAGVVVIDVKRYKQSESVDSLYEAFASIADKLYYFDQDFLNIRFHGKIHFLKQTYNFCTAFFRYSNYKKMLEEASLVHFLDKPWKWRASYRVMKVFLKYSIDKTVKKQVQKVMIKGFILRPPRYLLFLAYQPLKLIKPLREFKERIFKKPK